MRDIVKESIREINYTSKSPIVLALYDELVESYEREPEYPNGVKKDLATLFNAVKQKLDNISINEGIEEEEIIDYVRGLAFGSFLPEETEEFEEYFERLNEEYPELAEVLEEENYDEKEDETGSNDPDGYNPKKKKTSTKKKKMKKEEDDDDEDKVELSSCSKKKNMNEEIEDWKKSVKKII